MLLKHGLAGLAKVPDAGGNFAGVTFSSTGVVSENLVATSSTNSFAIANNTDTVAIIAVNLRLAKANVAVSVTGIGSATNLINVTDTPQLTLWWVSAPSTTSIEVVTTSDANLGQITTAVWHARDCAFGTPQTNTTVADPMSVAITASAGSSVIGQGIYNNGGGAPTAVGFSAYDWSVDTNSNDYSWGGHVNSLSAGSDNYGQDTASVPGNAIIGAIEVSQA